MIKITTGFPMYKDEPNFVNTTSRSKDWGRGLSPFLNGPCPLYEGAPTLAAKNIENAWQYAKVYKQHTDQDGNPTEEYFKWARIGFLTQKGIRYPMGKGAKPEYSWWAGEKLGYLEARKKIYIPTYTECLKKTHAFKKLISFYKEHKDIELWDFDGYDHDKEGLTLEQAIMNPGRNLGHAFVLKKMLLDEVGEM